MYKISIGTSSCYKAAAYYKEDELLSTVVHPYKFSLSLIHSDNLESVIQSLEHFSTIADKEKFNVTPDDELVVEIKDKSVIKWITTLVAPTNYSKEFMHFLRSLDQLPCQVKFVYIEDPIASCYATQQAFNNNKRKEVSTSMNDLLLNTDE